MSTTQPPNGAGAPTQIIDRVEIDEPTRQAIRSELSALRDLLVRGAHGHWVRVVGLDGQHYLGVLRRETSGDVVELLEQLDEAPERHA